MTTSIFTPTNETVATAHVSVPAKKSFSRSEIMTNAWSFVKTAAMTISEGLKKAWAQAKGLVATPKKEVVEIETSWHKADAKFAMTYAQLQYIEDLMTAENIENWGWGSSSQAFRRITKAAASEIIDALKSGKIVKIV